MQKKCAALLLFLFTGIVCMAQQTNLYTDTEKDYKTGLELFDKEKYGAAQELFCHIINTEQHISTEIRSNAAYYAAVCAMELFHPDAERRFSDFVTEYPESPKYNTACFQLGKLYYRQKNYKNAIGWFEKTDSYYLGSAEIAEYHFKIGYSYFNRGELDSAANAFYEIKDIDTKYTPPANYYYAHIAYENKNYETALKAFIKLRDSEVFAPLVPQYIAQIYFQQGKYDSLIAYATPLLSHNKFQNSLEVARLLGEAFYRKAQYREAIPYIEEYQKNTSILFREDYYQLGFSYYMTQAYLKAIPLFEKAVSDNDSLAQNTYYLLADCFVRTNDRQSARNAFFFASRMNYDQKIKEDAIFSYAKLSFELSYQTVAISTFQQYAEKYPNTPRADEANEYLAEIYLTTRNYKDALASLEKVKNKNDRTRAAYQRVAYSRAIELFNDGKYGEAIALFDKSIAFPADGKTTALANYWKGEGFYKLGDYPKAIRAYNDFIFFPPSINLPAYNLASYNTGYCYFKLEDYANAQTWFRKYIHNKEDTDPLRYNDALLRIADAFFVTRDYFNAIDFYNQAIKNKTAANDYALFQKATILGIQDKPAEKLTTLRTLTEQYPSSVYYDDAMYETGNTYLQAGDFTKAMGMFTTVTENYPTSSHYKKSLLGMALVYYNQKQDEKAIDLFKKIITSYPATSEANEALLGLKNIYVEEGKANEYYEWVKASATFASVSRAEEDSTLYEAAEKKYLAGNCNAAQQQFGTYILQFPNGYFILNASFYKAECDRKTKLLDQALAGYNFVAGQPRNTFTEKALLALGSIYFEQKQYDAALGKYNMLEQLSEYKSTLLEARTGQMRCNYNLTRYEAARVAAHKLLESEKIQSQLMYEAYFISGKSALALDSLEAAIKELGVVSKLNSSLGAEAKYHLASIQYKLTNYKEAQKLIFELVNQVPSYSYWIGKGFLLLADCYLVSGDTFQAKHTLKSILDSYEKNPADPEDIKVLAQDKLNQIIEKENQQKKMEQLEKEKLAPAASDSLPRIPINEEVPKQP